MISKPRIPGIHGDINKLRALSAPVKAIPEFITESVQRSLWQLFHEMVNRDQQGTYQGSITILPDTQDELSKRVLELLNEYLYQHVNSSIYKFVSATFVQLSDRPGPHIDSGLIHTGEYKGHNRLDSVAGKQIFLPIALNDDVNFPDEKIGDLVTIYTNQRWYGLGTNFLKGDSTTRSWYQANRKEIYDYQGMDGWSDDGFSKEVFDHYLKGFVHPSAMEGMTCGAIIPWSLRQAALFDVAHIHSASDTTLTEITSKLFLNLHFYHRYPENLVTVQS